MLLKSHVGRVNGQIERHILGWSAHVSACSAGRAGVLRVKMGTLPVAHWLLCVRFPFTQGSPVLRALGCCQVEYLPSAVPLMCLSWEECPGYTVDHRNSGCRPAPALPSAPRPLSFLFCWLWAGCAPSRPPGPPWLPSRGSSSVRSARCWSRTPWDKAGSPGSQPRWCSSPVSCHDT